MGKVHHLMSTQKLPASLQETWKFFSDPRNLLTITPPFLNLKVADEIFGDEVYAGQIITYKIKPFAGIALFWATEITHLVQEKMFVDEQRKGPYKLWHHQHHFKPANGGTEMTDIVHYSLPYGIAGESFHSIVRRKLLEIFTFRYSRINDLFGHCPAGELAIKIN